ncbi:MAG TPA: peptidase S10 [Hyphomicrobiaceae bacterium]|nr:peptidase S10 [Hyphomicrobiaceae bacterium]
MFHRPATATVRQVRLIPALLVVLAAICLAANLASAQEGAPAKGKPEASAPVAKAAQRVSPPAPSRSHHTLDAGGRHLAYTAVAGTLPLLNGKGDPAAHVFNVAYTLDDATSPRPITFVLNGGPGAASAFLHLGGLGPRGIDFNDKGSAPVEPVALHDNPDTWLSFTDLVFIDPVATGYSRTVAGTEEADRAYFGIDKDATALVDVIRLYLTRTERLLSPVFIAGESYGGFRAALLANRLLHAGISVRGIVLISPALEFSMLRGDRYTLLPQAMVLPSLAAAHLELAGGAGASFEPLAEVERFARTDYLLHMAAGEAPDSGIDRKLSRYVGLPVELLRRHGSRVGVRLFRQEYLRDNDRQLSSYDAAVSVPIPRGSQAHHDPILDGAVAVLAPAFTRYARSELGYDTDLEYKLLNRGVSGHWDYGTTPTRQGFAGALDDLQQARVLNNALGVLVVNGYTDLVTPYAMSRYLISQLPPIESARPIELKVYRGGHMMYLRPASRKALSGDAGAFYRSVLGGP